MTMHLYPTPHGTLRAEWDGTPQSSHQVAFYQHLTQFIKQDLGLGLLVNGLSTEKFSVSPSLLYWRILGQEFIQALRRIEDLNRGGQNFVVAVPEHLGQKML